MSSPDQEPPPTSGPDWATIQDSAEFVELRKRLRGFVFPMTVAFLVWYLLYVLLSDYAHDFMSTKVVGNINIGLIFGLLQFVTTFGITMWYVRWADKEFDPRAEALHDELEEMTR